MFWMIFLSCLWFIDSALSEDRLLEVPIFMYSCSQTVKTIDFKISVSISKKLIGRNTNILICPRPPPPPIIDLPAALYRLHGVIFRLYLNIHCLFSYKNHSLASSHLLFSLICHATGRQELVAITSLNLPTSTEGPEVPGVTLLE